MDAISKRQFLNPPVRMTVKQAAEKITARNATNPFPVRPPRVFGRKKPK
jgi:hypothetical protein